MSWSIFRVQCVAYFLLNYQWMCRTSLFGTLCRTYWFRDIPSIYKSGLSLLLPPSHRNPFWSRKSIHSKSHGEIQIKLKQSRLVGEVAKTPQRKLCHMVCPRDQCFRHSMDSRPGQSHQQGTIQHNYQWMCCTSLFGTLCRYILRVFPYKVTHCHTRAPSAVRVRSLEALLREEK